MPGPLIGVDIGTTGVRAVELAESRGHLSLKAAGQIGLPPDAVTDGEVTDPAAVADALRRLWAEGGFSGRRVILGASGQRVIVRQTELPSLAPAEFRSAVKFEAEQLIPLPSEETELAYSVLGEADGDPKKVRVLLAAAHREVLTGYLDAAAAAGLTVEAIDANALAMLRALGRTRAGAAAPGPDQRDAVINIGANLTTVAVSEDFSAGFVRVFSGGGATLTAAVAAGETETSWSEAEAVKRAMTPANCAVLVAAGEPLIADISQSLDFFITQHPGTQLRRAYVTGGGALAAGVFEDLSRHLDLPVEMADPFDGIDTRAWSDDLDCLRRLSPVALAATGLAQWSLKAPTERFSLLPAAVQQRRAARRDMRRAALAMGGTVAILLAAWGAQEVRVSNAQQVSARYRSASAAEQARVNALAPVTHYFAAVNQRVTRDKTALAGSVDWRAVVEKIAAVMPPHTVLTGFQVTPPPPPAPTTSSSAANSAPAAPLVPAAGSTVTMDVTAVGDVRAVATWLQAMSSVRFLENPWVASSSVTPAQKGVPSKVVFVCTASLNATAPVQHPNVGGGS